MSLEALNAPSGIRKIFQERVKSVAEEEFDLAFKMEAPIPIGNTGQKFHRFDLVSDDYSIVIECKCYSWTEGKNIPSAKLSTLNEAVFFLSFVKNARRIIVLKRSLHPTTSESIAEHYVRSYEHLLKDVEIWELEETSNCFRSVFDGRSESAILASNNGVEISYEAAKEKALGYRAELNTVVEYKDAYLFYNADARGDECEDNDVVIMKASGRILSMSEYAMQSEVTGRPKKRRF